MNWNQLQYVITIAEEKKYHQSGAEALYFPAFPFSLSIQALEKKPESLF